MMLKPDGISEGAELEWKNFALGRDMCNWSQDWSIKDQWKMGPFLHPFPYLYTLQRDFVAPLTKK